MAEASLASQNPWWLDSQNIDNDPIIQNAAESKISWTPRLFHKFNLKEDVVYTLRGPRQVGKTTLVKLIIQDLVKRGITGRRIFYWTCDMIQGPSDLLQILNTFIDTTRSSIQDRLYIFLDEISAVQNWQKTIKYLYDTGKLENITLILTGSHSLDIKTSSERLPGRRGSSDDIIDKVLVPMKFPEFVEIREPDLRQLLLDNQLLNFNRRLNLFLEISKGNIPHEIRELNLYQDRISRLFEEYLITGGIIKAISTYSEYRKIPRNLYNTYITTTIGDITNYGKRESYLNQLLKVIIEKLPYPLSWNSLKNATDVGNAATVAEYVDILKCSYVLCPIYKIDRSINGPNIRKEKKIHFLDPFIFHSLHSWVDQREPFRLCLDFISDDIKKSNLIESVVCDHLIRFSYNMNLSNTFDPSRNVFYWSNRKTEVDNIMKINSDYVGFEVKYRNQIDASDYKGLYSFYDARSDYKGVLLSKKSLKIHNEIVTIPIPIMLMLI